MITSQGGEGGGQVWIHQLATHLAERGHDVRVYPLRVRPPWRSETRQFHPAAPKLPYRVTVVDVPLFAGPKLLARRLRQDLAREPADVVLSTGWEAVGLSPGGVLPAHVASVHHPHDAYAPLGRIARGFAWPTRRRFLENYFRLNAWLDVERCKKAPLVVCSAQDHARRVASHGVDPAKVVVLPYGVHAASPSDAKAHDVLYAGGPHDRKGAGDLLRAIPRGRPLRLALAGPGDWSPYWALIDALRPEVDVELLGPLPHEAMLEAFARSRVVAAPSYFESFGLVYAEALGAGTPVVAYATATAPEIVREGESGLLVPAGDVAALRSALSQLLADPERARAMGEAGRRSVQERFAWPRVAQRWEALLAAASDPRASLGAPQAF